VCSTRNSTEGTAFLTEIILKSHESSYTLRTVCYIIIVTSLSLSLSLTFKLHQLQRNFFVPAEGSTWITQSYKYPDDRQFRIQVPVLMAVKSLKSGPFVRENAEGFFDCITYGRNLFLLSSFQNWRAGQKLPIKFRNNFRNTTA
jgi:hypothetical protein